MKYLKTAYRTCKAVFSQKMDKHGQISFRDMPQVMIAALLAVVVGAVAVIVIASLKTGQTNATVNTTLDQGISFFSNVFNLLPTGGTLLVVGIILGIILAAVGGFLYVRGRGGGM